MVRTSIASVFALTVVALGAACAKPPTSPAPTATEGSGGTEVHEGMGGAGRGPGMMGGDMRMMGAMSSDSGPMMTMGGANTEAGAPGCMTPLDPSRLGQMRQPMQEHAPMMNDAHGCPRMGGSR